MNCASCGKVINREQVMEVQSTRHALPDGPKDRGQSKWIALCPQCAERRHKLPLFVFLVLGVAVAALGLLAFLLHW
jgi:hypothetical protein